MQRVRRCWSIAMPQRADVKKILNKASDMEKKYNWPAASKLYEQAFDVIQTSDLLKRGEIQERIGFCLYRAAMQAESKDEFEEKIQQAVEAYKNVHKLYEKLANGQKVARRSRADAFVKYLEYWLTSDPSAKRKLLDECLDLKGKALAAFSKSGNMVEYSRTYCEPPLAFLFRACLEWDNQVSKELSERGSEWGKKAIAALTEHDDSHVAAKVNFALATCLWLFMPFIADPEKQEQHRLKVVERLKSAVKLSEKAGDSYIGGLAYMVLGESTWGTAQSYFEKLRECGDATGDNLLKGAALDYLAYMTHWKAFGIEAPDQRKKLAEEAMQFYDKGQHHHSIISFLSPRGGVIAPPGGYAEHYLLKAAWETNLEKKLEFLEKSEKAGLNALEVAEDADVPFVIGTMFHMLSKTLQARAHLEPDIDKKRSLLERALKYREKTIEGMEQLTPFDYWNLGVMYNYFAQIEAELSYVEQNLNNKRSLLEEAVSNKERALTLIAKIVPLLEKTQATDLFAALGEYQNSYGTLLNRLYELTENPERLKEAIEVFHKAIESVSKLDMTSRIAELYWKIAKTQDILGKHLKAAENFEHASENFTKAAEKIPQLKEFYINHAVYMQAWSQIEKARHHHAERRYGPAKEHYEKAASLHQSTERWNYLASNYLAWARLEEAEDLSRRELEEEATQAFKEASELFCKAKTSIRTELKKIQDADEKRMAATLIKVSDLRHEYCRGRITLEDAKLLDRQGDHVASSEKYASAAKTFQGLAEAESEKSSKELQPIIFLCQAWQKMMMAEAKASSTMYGEAAELFKQAREYTTDQRTSLLALANSSFCKALEAGTEFEITRDMKKYSTAKRHMEAAENYYLKAGFKTASEYAKATYMLFDAYMYLNQAQKEIEPRKKAQYYQMTEKLLQASAGAYMTAKHPEKSEEVHRLLESVREKRQLAMSLSEVLHAPTIASATTSFSTPTSTHEQAVGLERFEHADIQASLILRVREVKIGQDIDLEIELVNAGKAPALLIKVQELIPEGFEVRRAPEIYRVEDSYVNMKGKQLAPLKTEEIKLILRPATKGTFILKPRIMYLDETGTYRSHEPEPVTVTVKELGITGWIKGEK